MILDQEKITRIKRLLKSRPKGLTISDISHTLKLNRNSVAKYLEILLITGEVEVRAYGNAKVYSLAQRVPLSSLLRFTTELILILDSDFRIIDVNDNFLSFLSLVKETLMGSDIRTLDIPSVRAISSRIFSGEEIVPAGTKDEITLSVAGKDCTLAFKTVPTVFDDASRGFTLIFEDVTQSREFERKLKTSEELYRAIVEDQTEFICRFDHGLCFSFINGALGRFTGQSREEIPGKNILSFVHPGDREKVMEGIRTLSPGHEVVTLEYRVVGPTGDVMWHQWTYRAITDESGRILEYQGVGRDITGKKLAEERLSILNMAIASSINGIGIVSLDGNISYANEQFLEIFGISGPEEVTGRPFVSLGVSASPQVDLGVVLREVGEKGEWSGEIIIARKDGSRTHAHCTAHMVRDSAGTPLAIMVSFFDITEKIEAERVIRIQNTAIEAATNAIVIFDEEEHLIYANRVFLSLFGAKDLRDMQENHMEDFWSLTRFFSPPFDEIRRELSQKGVWAGEIHVQVKERPGLFFQASTTRVKDERGDPLCSIYVLMDISGQKAVEKALKTTYEKLQEAVEFMPDPTFIIGREKKVIAWNRSMEVLSGVKKRDILGSDRYREALLFMHGTMPVLVDILGFSAHELARAYPSVRKFGDSIYSEMTLSASREGEERLLWAKATPLFDSDGNNVGAIESFRDITEWKRARESLPVPVYTGDVRPAEQAGSGHGEECGDSLLDSLLCHISDGCALLGPEGRVNRVNPSLATFLEISPDEMRGRLFTEFCDPKDTERIRQCIFSPEERGAHPAGVRVRVGNNGQSVILEVSSIHGGNGQPIGRLVFVRPGGKDWSQ